MIYILNESRSISCVYFKLCYLYVLSFFYDLTALGGGREFHITDFLHSYLIFKRVLSNAILSSKDNISYAMVRNVFDYKLLN